MDISLPHYFDKIQNSRLLFSSRESSINNLGFQIKYCVLLQNHIYKEDNVLYPMAENALTDEQKELVNQKYHEVELKLKSEMDFEALKFL